MVVDDDPINVELLCAYLEDDGYRTTSAYSGAEALEQVAKLPPDLIFLDVMMPGLSGFEVCSQLKSGVESRFIPVVLVTALTAMDDRILGITAGADDFLSKPVNRSELTARTRSLIRLKQAVDEVQVARREVLRLNEQLTNENLRMSHELEITRRLQQMVLPQAAELTGHPGVSIAAEMQPAAEVGGDYYDVIAASGGRLKVAIGDVTGHGLESGVLMLMVQMGVRTLHAAGEDNPERFLAALNEAVWGNMKRIGSEKTLSLSILDYEDGRLKLSGQHENVLVSRPGQPIEVIDTLHLGFPVGLVEDIQPLVTHRDLRLEQGDTLVLYSDGIVEAEAASGEQYGMSRLCSVLQTNQNADAEGIKGAILCDHRDFIGSQDISDDVTLVVLKQL
jgi:sigma-B regulation protein RsbU (phosphoserine phosphatase)